MKKFLPKTGYHSLQKLLNNTVPNTMAINLLWKLSKILDMSKIKLLVYTADKYNLQIRILSFSDPEKLLKEVATG